MNIKKKLQEERKKIDEQILAEGKELHDSLVAQYCTETTSKPPVKKKNYVKWIASVSCVIVICLAIGLGVGLTRPKSPEYFVEDATEVIITENEFINATKEKIGIGENYTISNYKRIYDLVSSNDLYYRIEFEHKTDYVAGQASIVVNPYYDYAKQYFGNIQKSKFNQYDMEYSVRETVLEDIPMNEYFGCIDYNSYKIYFSFTELRLDDTKSPNAVLNELLILK